ncbi:hypothetical protein SAMN06295970_121102, partial [Noviherbaspirillum suwonense]
ARSPKPEARSPKPEAQSPKPKAQSPKPEARSPKPSPKHKAQPSPKPKAQSPKPETRNPKPETRNPKPETRNPKPETRNPKQDAFPHAGACRCRSAKQVSRNSYCTSFSKQSASDSPKPVRANAPQASARPMPKIVGANLLSVSSATCASFFDVHRIRCHCDFCVSQYRDMRCTCSACPGHLVWRKELRP